MEKAVDVSKKMRMAPFDLKAAKEGKPVCTVSGLKVQILRFDVKDEIYPLLALVEDVDGEYYEVAYTNTGHFNPHPYADVSDLDLRMVNNL